MIGTRLSHYRILERLGAGGMGEVYLAEDMTLKRQVALKLLASEVAVRRQLLERFQREAEILAALNHPNIVTIHTVEEAEGARFLTMELVEGERLQDLIPRGGMALRKIFDVAVPLADALSSAHERGVIHRDLKPSNVMVNREGRTKVLDFGLAKLREEALSPSDSSEASTDALTDEAQLLGTIPYMSPEQLDGRPLDARSDLFSLGALLYEMSTGERPFKSKSSASLISEIMRDMPPDADVVRRELPHHLGRIVRRCLEKDPDRRYQAAKDIRNDLADLRRELESSASDASRPRPRYPLPRRLPTGWRAAAAAAVLAAAVIFALWRPAGPPESMPQPPVVSPAARQMIVVLPFDNLGPPEDEYFAAGMTDEIASRLASVEGLGVISRTTASQYKDDRPPLGQIAAELGVDFVLEGSVRWEQDASGRGRVRIIPQLVRASDDTQLWSRRYVRVLDDLFAVQGEIAEEVIDELRLTIGEPVRQAMKERPTEDLEAYLTYLRGMDYRRSPDYSESDLELAAQLFGRAVELDPEFVQAWAELSWVHSMIFFNSDSSDDRAGRAATALARARELAPASAAVRAAAGFYHYRVESDFERALEEFDAALRGLPGNVDVLAGIGYVRRRQGKWEESLEALQRAFELDPRSGERSVGLAETYYALRRYAVAAPYFDRAVAVAPDEPGFWGGKVFNELELRGSLAAARELLSATPIPSDPEIVMLLAILDLFARRFEAALARLDSVSAEPLGPFAQAEVQHLAALAELRLGREEAARRRLETTRARLEQTVEEFPDDAFSRIRLARTYARLGRGEAALAEGRRAARQFADDRFTGPRFTEDLAVIYMSLGEADEAVARLEELLSTPYQNATGIVQLRLHPLWDPLRDHPGFRRLVEDTG